MLRPNAYLSLMPLARTGAFRTQNLELKTQNYRECVQSVQAMFLPGLTATVGKPAP